MWEGTDRPAGGIWYTVTRAAVEAAVDLAIEGTGTAALYRAHVPGAVRLAYLLTGDAACAQDVAHDAFLKAAARLRFMHDPDRFASYLRRTVVRGVLMHRRSAEREEARERRAAGQGAGAVVDHAGNASAHLDLVAALATLPSRQRAALVLRYWLDLPEAEIARALDCRPGTVKSTLARALEALRKVVPADV